MHTKSRKLKIQRQNLALASQHYAHLSPSQKATTRHQIEEVEYQTSHGKTDTKLLLGRQLFISKDIHCLNVAQRQILPPLEACIILSDQDRNPLAGQLWLRYLKDYQWHDVPKLELSLGSWMFAKVPARQQAYQVYGEAPGFIDPCFPRYQYMTETALRAHHYHSLFFIGDLPSHTFFPTVDGIVAQDCGYLSGQGVDWATVVSGPGTGATSHRRYGNPFEIVKHYYDEGKWRALIRALFLFNTSSLPPDCIILHAIFSLWGYAKNDPLQIAPNVNIYSTDTAYNTTLVPSDYARVGSIPLCDTPITWADWIIADPHWNNFVLNAAGRAAISKTGMTKIATRNANYDVSGVSPIWPIPGERSQVWARWSEYGPAWSPRLTIYYTLPSADSH